MYIFDDFLKKLYLRYNYQSQKTKERLGKNYCNTCENKKLIFIRWGKDKLRNRKINTGHEEAFHKRGMSNGQ